MITIKNIKKLLKLPFLIAMGLIAMISFLIDDIVHLLRRLRGRK